MDTGSYIGVPDRDTDCSYNGRRFKNEIDELKNMAKRKKKRNTHHSRSFQDFRFDIPVFSCVSLTIIVIVIAVAIFVLKTRTTDERPRRVVPCRRAS